MHHTPYSACITKLPLNQVFFVTCVHYISIYMWHALTFQVKFHITIIFFRIQVLVSVPMFTQGEVMVGSWSFKLNNFHPRAET
jgi:hypothetical protein